MKDQTACCFELNFVGEVDSSLEESEFDLLLFFIFTFAQVHGFSSIMGSMKDTKILCSSYFPRPCSSPCLISQV